MEKEYDVGSSGDGSSGRNTPRSLNQDAQRRVDTPGPMPTYQYSREQLFELSVAPASKIRPSCLSKEFDSSDGIWDPERWGRSFGGGSRGSSPLTIGDTKERRQDHPRRTSGSLDPREKLLHEEDGIVLSPQRRSFGTGCHVTHPLMGRQISCPADLQDRERDRRDHRRIGSGRIQIDHDREAPRERDRDFRNPRDRFERDDRERGDRRFDSRDRDRGFRQRDFEERRDFRDRGFTREISRRRNSYRHDEEPEWFTGGPSSQTEMIELHGFDKVENRSPRGTPMDDLVHEKDEEKRRRKVEPHEKNDLDELEGEQRGDEVEEHVDEHDENIRETRQKDKKYEGIRVADRNGSLETNESSSPETNASDNERRRNTSPSTSSLFDFNEFFKLEHIPGLNDFPAELDVQGIAGSRFYQLFKRSTSGSQGNSKENSRRSSLNEEFGYLNDLLNGSRSPIIPSPPPPSANALFERSSFFHSFNTSLGEKQGSTFDLSVLQKGGNMNPLVNALLNNALAAEKQSRSPTVNISTQDAEAQLKALLFGRSSGTPSSSGTASPGFSSPLNSRVKTLAEIEGDFTMQQSDNGLYSTMKNQSNVNLSTPLPNFTHNSTSHQSGSIVEQQEEGDLTAFNKLIGLMKAGAATPVESPKLPLKSEIDQPMSPITSMMPPPAPPVQLGSAAQNEFLQALQRNKEEQLHIRQQTLQQMRYQSHLPQQQRQPSPVLHTPVPTSIQQPNTLTAPPPHSQQPLPAPATQTQPTHSQTTQQAVLLQRRLSQGDPIMNFIKQNPTIITKPASPTPPPSQQALPILNTSTSHGPSPSPIMQQPALLSQQLTSSPRVPSPIMFSQQPPMHLSAPSPIHPSQRSVLAQSPTGQPTTLTSTATIRPPSVSRVPSPQELIAHTQAILQNALIKKQLEDQKERFYKRQQERTKSPNPQGAAVKTMADTPITTSQTKMSVSAAFTPTSVIRKMHSEKASEKEKQKQEKQDGISDEKNSASNQKPPPVMQLVNMDFMDKVRDSKEQSSNTEKALQTLYYKTVPVSAPEKSNPSIQQGTATWSSQMNTSASWTLTSPSVLASFSSQVSKHNTLSSGNQPVSVSQMMQMPPPPIPGGTLGGQNVPGSQEQIITANHQADKKQQQQLLRALMGQGNMQTCIPIQVQTIATSLQTPGRPIVKGISNVSSMSTSTPTQSHPSVQLPQMMATPISKLDQTPFQQRAIMGIATSTPIAGNLDLTKVLQQQQQANRPFNPSPNLQARSVGNMTPNTPYGIPITGRLPVQTPPVPVHPSTANAIMIQQMIQQQQSANTSRANTLNHLAALQAQQQRMLDSRYQGAVRGMYAAGVVPQMLSPRGPIGNPSMPGSMGAGLGRPFSPHIIGPKSSLNGPVSPSALSKPMVTSAASFINGNNNVVNGGEQANLLKWFGSDVLKTQLPNLPPLPHQGQRVMTVDEIERS